MTKTNPQLIALIEFLEEAADEHEAAIWRDIARRLQKSSQRWAEVNVDEIAKHLNDGETALVPGKVLGSGIAPKMDVAAFSFSRSAREKIEAAGGSCLSIRDLVEHKSDGRNVRIIGG
ncbi:MAG: 50S ribosomal protein L18e [Thermoplasmatota archaeon]